MPLRAGHSVAVALARRSAHFAFRSKRGGGIDAFGPSCVCRMASLLDAAGEWLERTNPQITREPIVDAGGVPTYWFLEPKQYILETIICNAVFIPLAWWLNRKPWPVDIPRARTVADKAGPPTAVPAWLKALDYFLRVVCVACLGATLYYKLSTGRLVYCFQPCHLSNLLLTYLCFSRSETAGKLFYLCVPAAAQRRWRRQRASERGRCGSGGSLGCWAGRCCRRGQRQRPSPCYRQQCDARPSLAARSTTTTALPSLHPINCLVPLQLRQLPVRYRARAGDT